MNQLIIATCNPHKRREFAELLGDQFEIRDLAGMEVTPAEETGQTFEENAILKALEVSRQISGLVVADDSGLEVEALNGAPGIFSARYAGENATDQANIEKLLRELSQRGSASRSARFCCCLALACAGEVVQTFEGEIQGEIVTPPRGNHGFGYDPVFQPKGFDQTFAELQPAQKNQISHRANAIRSLRRALMK